MEHAAAQRYGRRIQDYDVHIIGSQMVRDSAPYFELHLERLVPFFRVDGKIDIAQRASSSLRDSTEEIGKYDPRALGQGFSQCREPRVYVGG